MNNTTLEIDFTDLDAIRKAIDEYGNVDHMLYACNEDGEDQTIHISSDHIVLETYQNNGWTRIQTYWYDGTKEITYKK